MWAPIILLLFFNGGLSTRMARFTNLKCKVLDPSYCVYDKCHLKMLGRGIVGINVEAKLLKGPFNNAKVNLSLWRKFNGFRPFMFNVTFDFCKFMLKSNAALSFQKIFLDAVGTKSNLNHSCPYKKEIVVRDLVFENDFLKFLPLPSGEYQIQLIAATDNDWKTKVDVNFFLEENYKNS
ncbi:uncharacterized protein LOC133845784 [Drosophila sulfurigaster albostrigata]|uniref:uncharacterized protein LOC133845784 n=1 Tax=Drosophila sulfurigaster albostrigata TaxID=89887 RepID=UPI002D21EDB5|nr:uncharacterized protein LOC133845784 [Drosophila sulfurigaster albostrigata]